MYTLDITCPYADSYVTQQNYLLLVILSVEQSWPPTMRQSWEIESFGRVVTRSSISAITFFLNWDSVFHSLQAEAEREQIMQDPKATMPAAFVSFKTRWGAAVCAQTQQNQDPTIWLTDWAPEPRDVVWANLAIPHVELGFRSLAMSVVVFLLVFFYMIPIVTVQSLANLQGIQKISPSLDGFVRKWVSRVSLSLISMLQWLKCWLKL